MKKNAPIETSSSVFINLTTRDGKPLILKADFIAAVLSRRDGDQRWSKIIYDGKRETLQLEVQEGLSKIDGPFAQIGSGKFNPAYVNRVEKNTADNREEYPNNIVLDVPGGHRINMSSGMDTIYRALTSALG